MKPFPPDPNSRQSTISTVEREIREAGGDAHAIAADVRDVDSVAKMVNETVRVCTLHTLRPPAWLMVPTRYTVVSTSSSIILVQSGGPP